MSDTAPGVRPKDARRGVPGSESERGGANDMPASGGGGPQRIIGRILYIYCGCVWALLQTDCCSRKPTICPAHVQRHSTARACNCNGSNPRSAGV